MNDILRMTVSEGACECRTDEHDSHRRQWWRFDIVDVAPQIAVAHEVSDERKIHRMLASRDAAESHDVRMRRNEAHQSHLFAKQIAANRLLVGRHGVRDRQMLDRYSHVAPLGQPNSCKPTYFQCYFLELFKFYYQRVSFIYQHQLDLEIKSDLEV